MLSMRSAIWRSTDVCSSSAVLEAPVGSPWRSWVSIRPLSSTTVTPSASSPSTLAATRCTMPSICERPSVRPGTSFTTTEADGRRSSATKSERSGSARWTRGASTPPATSSTRRAGGSPRKKPTSCRHIACSLAFIAAPHPTDAPSHLHPQDLLVRLDDLVPDLHHQLEGELRLLDRQHRVVEGRGA